jgi:hypothetical protein
MRAEVAQAVLAGLVLGELVIWLVLEALLLLARVMQGEPVQEVILNVQEEEVVLEVLVEQEIVQLKDLVMVVQD